MKTNEQSTCIIEIYQKKNIKKVYNLFSKFMIIFLIINVQCTMRRKAKSKKYINIFKILKIIWTYQDDTYYNFGFQISN